MVRIIHYSNADGSREGVAFTEDEETKAKDFVPPGCKLVSDTSHDIDLPSSFPSEHTFEKV
jgi:hypothetical protein